MSVSLCIHRGADTIGGTCIEVIASNGDRVLLDLGLPLDAENNDAALLPDVRGLTERTPDLLALIISHPHQDHYGLGKHIDPAIPVYMGAAANRIMQACVSFGLPDAFQFQNVCEMKGFETFNLGTFKIMPYPVDHAGYDSYALLIEADGKRIFYTGDFRAHGRKGKLFDHLLKRPPRNVDVLLMEGSALGRLNPEEEFESESALEDKFHEVFKATRGLVLVHPSSQNIDRIVSIYRAAKKSGRILVMGGYTGYIIKVLDNPNIPNFTWADVKKIVSTPTGKRHEITADTIAESPDKYVYIIGGKGLPMIEKAGLLTSEAHYVYSMWSGYKQTSAGKMIAKMESAGVPMSDIHTSGHADVPTLRKFVEAIKPSRLVPIHTFNPEQFEELFGQLATVERHDNNEVFEV